MDVGEGGGRVEGGVSQRDAIGSLVALKAIIFRNAKTAVLVIINWLLVGLERSRFPFRLPHIGDLLTPGNGLHVAGTGGPGAPLTALHHRQFTVREGPVVDFTHSPPFVSPARPPGWGRGALWIETAPTIFIFTLSAVDDFPVKSMTR